MSYIHRAVSTSWFYIWFIFYVSRWNRFEAFRLRRLQRFELRSVVTILILLALGLQLVYDIGSARLKYLEGFWTNPKTHEIQSKPAQAWTEDDMVHVEPLYYTLACSLSLQNCAFFLLQAFWSYISKSVTKSSFMSSLEFKIHVVASCCVVALFPTVQYLFRNDFVYREGIPQFIFCILLFTTGILGLRVHFRLVALIKNASITLNEYTLHVLEKLEYFKDMNVILTFSLFACAFSLGILAGDGLSPTPRIATNNSGNNIGRNSNTINQRHNIVQQHKRGPSDHFRLSRRNNEVHQSDEYDGHIQNHSKAQLAQNGDLDSFWEAARAFDEEEEYQCSIRHNRAQSHGSCNDTAITLTTLSPPPPALTIVTSSSNASDTPSINAKATTSPTSVMAPSLRSPTSPTAAAGTIRHRPERETRTLYYAEALAKAQQQQQEDQANEYHSMTNAANNANDINNSQKNTTPRHKHTSSQGSSQYTLYSTNGGSNNGYSNNSSAATRPERSHHRSTPTPSSHSHGSDKNTSTKDHHYRVASPVGRNTPIADQSRPSSRGNGATSPTGGRSGSSADYRFPRDNYPSIAHTATTANADYIEQLDDTQHVYSPSIKRNTGNNRPLSPIAQQETNRTMLTDPRTVDPRSVSALGHAPTQYQPMRRESEESDLSVIQIAYVGNLNQAQLSPNKHGHRQSTTSSEFYDGLSSAALRTYSPR
ncbi:hypothetical protein FBU30_000129 [Linnemannia zychae]|nr:hypothetical protein FBU30_000129 [Linnemannia zychae]